MYVIPTRCVSGQLEPIIPAQERRCSLHALIFEFRRGRPVFDRRSERPGLILSESSKASPELPGWPIGDVSGADDQGAACARSARGDQEARQALPEEARPERGNDSLEAQGAVHHPVSE
jgi:hypothetical protein